MPGRIGKSGRVRSRACTWLFSSIDKTLARSGGKKYSPTMSRHFLDELGIRRQLERVEAMRLQPKRLPDTRDCGLGESRHIGQAPRGPLRGVGWGAFEGAGNDLHDSIIGGLAWRARPRLIGQSRQTTNAKSLAPFADAVTRDAEALGHRAIGETLRAG